MPLSVPLVVGNWKMNGRRADGLDLAATLRVHLDRTPGIGTLAICPPATLLAPVAEAVDGSRILLGAQDCAVEAKGAFTGDISAPMVRDVGCLLVIVGHSERRHGHGETDALVEAKAAAGLASGLTVILCIGETEAQWLAGETLAVLDGQLDGSLPGRATAANLVVAYEPVWAIGTGRTPSPDDIARTHAHLRARMTAKIAGGEQVRLLYGGSVSGDNAGEIMAIADVDGVLVGGASLNAEQFWTIYQAGQGDD